MIQEFNGIKNKIISYDRRYSHDRDCISLFFEYVDEGIFRINKFYYNSKNFLVFLASEFNNDTINYLNLKTSKYFVDRGEMLETLLYLSDLLFKSNYIHEAESLKNIAYRLEKYEKFQNNSVATENIESILEELNGIVFGYQYYFKIEGHKHYFNDELINLLNMNIKKVPYSKDAEDVDIPAGLPKKYDTVDNPLLFELRVYSVGQANCSALIKYEDESKSNYNVIAVFDFGLESKKKNRKLDEMINKIDENTTMVISHFHVDHFNNIVNFPLTKTCRWLFPEHEPKKYNSNLLYQSLIKIASRKSSSGTKVFSYKAPYDLSNYIRINQNIGSIGDYKHQFSLVNAQSIIVSLHIENTNVLIPADALYKDFPKDVFSYEYDYVLIPHHGCKYCDKLSATSSYYNSAKSIILDKTKGVVMCGYEGKKYGHANTNHLGWYNYICAFKGASFYTSKYSPDYTYCPSKIETFSYYKIEFK